MKELGYIRRDEGKMRGGLNSRKVSGELLPIFGWSSYFLGVVIGDLVFLGGVQAKSIKK